MILLALETTKHFEVIIKHVLWFPAIAKLKPALVPYFFDSKIDDNSLSARSSVSKRILVALLKDMNERMQQSCCCNRDNTQLFKMQAIK